MTNEEQMQSIQVEINGSLTRTIDEVDELIASISRQLGSDQGIEFWDRFKKVRFALVTGALTQSPENLEDLRSMRRQVIAEFDLWEKLENLMELRSVLIKSRKSVPGDNPIELTIVEQLQETMVERGMKLKSSVLI